MEYTFYHRRPTPDNPCYIEGKYWYIGSTSNFRDRKYGHKNGCKNQKYLKEFVEENGGWDAWEFEVLEISEHKTKVERFMREQHFLDELKPCLNRQRAYNSEEDSKTGDKEYRKRNKERITGYKKEYHKKNKEKIKEYEKERYKKNKERIKARVKEYAKKNKVKIAKLRKERYKKNKERIAKRGAEKIECDNCDRAVSRSNILQHKRTKYCMSYNE